MTVNVLAQCLIHMVPIMSLWHHISNPVIDCKINLNQLHTIDSAEKRSKTGVIKSHIASLFWGNASTKQNRALCMASEATMIHRVSLSLVPSKTSHFRNGKVEFVGIPVVAELLPQWLSSGTVEMGVLVLLGRGIVRLDEFFGEKKKLSYQNRKPP